MALCLSIPRVDIGHQQLKKELEELQAHNKELQTSLESSQLESKHWKAQYQELKEEQEELRAHNMELQASLDSSELEVERWQARYHELKEQHQDTETSLTKARKQCEVRPGAGGPRDAGLSSLG